MGTAAWACFNCRTAVRRNTAFTGDVPCPNCGQPCSYLGYKIPVPPKAKGREWAALRDQLARERMQRELASGMNTVRGRHALEQEIARLEALPTNEGRTKAIRLLQRRLSGSNA
jgi:hypothetical protein